MSSFQTVSSRLSTADAARFSGRYETEVVDKDGKPVKVLRSLRQADVDELLLQGTITPTKAPPLKENALDDLCDLFVSKVAVTKSPKSPKVHTKVSKAVDSAILRQKKQSCRFDLNKKTAEVVAPRKKAPTPVSSLSPCRRSRRLSGGACTRSSGIVM